MFVRNMDLRSLVAHGAADQSGKRAHTGPGDSINGCAFASRGLKPEK